MQLLIMVICFYSNCRSKISPFWSISPRIYLTTCLNSKIPKLSQIESLIDSIVIYLVLFYKIVQLFDYLNDRISIRLIKKLWNTREGVRDSTTTIYHSFYPIPTPTKWCPPYMVTHSYKLDQHFLTTPTKYQFFSP